MPCLTSKIRRIAAALAAVHLAALAMPGFAQATARPPAATSAGSTEGDLVGRAKTWLSGRHQVSAAEIGVQALDARVQARGCPGSWVFDQPIAGNDSMLRARCPDTQWQVYLRVTLPLRPAAQAPGPSAAPSAASAPAQVLSAYNPPASRAPAAPPEPPIVKRGQIVMTVWSTVPGLVVSVRMEALEDGRMGDTIRLRNRESGRVVTATVNGPQSAQGL